MWKTPKQKHPNNKYFINDDLEPRGQQETGKAKAKSDKGIKHRSPHTWISLLLLLLLVCFLCTTPPVSKQGEVAKARCPGAAAKEMMPAGQSHFPSYLSTSSSLKRLPPILLFCVTTWEGGSQRILTKQFKKSLRISMNFLMKSL